MTVTSVDGGRAGRAEAEEMSLRKDGEGGRGRCPALYELRSDDQRNRDDGMVACIPTSDPRLLCRSSKNALSASFGCSPSFVRLPSNEGGQTSSSKLLAAIQSQDTGCSKTPCSYVSSAAVC